jgi:acyl-coenzyme A synthetase/AMP-(fatty) acid ligase
MTFAEVERDIDLLARGLTALGVARGTRTLMLVKPSFEFFTLSFALFRIGAVPVMLDPGMGRERVLGAILEVEPEAMIGIPKAHLARILFPRAFASVKIRVSTGWFGGRTLDEVRALGAKSPAIETARTQNEDVAAILFTSGSTGAPKGVIYTHGIFDEQVRIFREDLGIRRGEVDLSAFPLFSLFSTALGASVIVPDMDATRPAAVDPALIAESITDCDVTYAFGSPAFWRRIADHCEANKLVFTTLKRILMAGAPAPAALLARLVRTVPSDSEVYTPYGATESLPISLPTARELSGVEGAGTCVGKPLARATVKIIAISDDPIAMISNARELPVEEIGEICVKSAMTTRSYFRRPLDDAKSKIRDGHEVWHRMGDVGFFDRQGRLWFCGRKSHRVETSNGPMFTENVEKLFNAHPAVFRSALVGVGERGSQKPVIIIELEPGASATEQEMLDLAKRSETTRAIEKVLFHPSLPVDPRHNAKIIREELAVWAAAR